jgi:hypothetical protein
VTPPGAWSAVTRRIVSAGASGEDAVAAVRRGQPVARGARAAGDPQVLIPRLALKGVGDASAVARDRPGTNRRRRLVVVAPERLIRCVTASPCGRGHEAPARSSGHERPAQQDRTAMAIGGTR